MPTVYEVLAHLRDDYSGPAGDGSYVNRFHERSEADAFAKDKTYYGEPAEVHEREVSKELLRRWEREGKIQ